MAIESPKCPMIKIGLVFTDMEGDPPLYDMGHCLLSKCAWYIPSKQRCAMFVLANTLSKEMEE